MKPTNSRLTTVALSVLAMWYVVGCESGSGNGQQASSAVQYHTYNINAYPANKVVCDPMGGGGASSPKQGIKSELYYRTQGQPRYYSAQDYVDHTTKSDQNLFFSDINVPTRLFQSGFKTQTSDVLKDDSGNTLIEYFGLKMDTTIRLSDQDADGDYEFALLSDDGAILKINQNGNWSNVVSNDGDHPTRLGCSTQKFTLNHSSQLSSELLYYQGPRYHISNILLWRKLNSDQAAGQDQDCGNYGNNMWFDPNNNSQPTSKYQALLNRGWKVLTPANYYLPADSTETALYNPCTAGTVPTISDVRISELVSSDIWVNWSTDIPSTSQLMITRVSDGNTIITTTDNIVRTQHTIHYSGLQSNTAYQLRVINVSEDLGRAISDPIDFTTP